MKKACATIKVCKKKIEGQMKLQGIDQFSKHGTIRIERWKSIKEIGELLQEHIKGKHQYQEIIPLWWIVLQSLVVSLTRKGKKSWSHLQKAIEIIAEELGMEKETDDFLEALQTSSIL